MPNSAGTGSRSATNGAAASGSSGAEDEAREDAEGGEKADLDQVDGEDRAAGGAERLQRRDRRGLRLEMRAHRRGDADPADREAGEPDEDQEGAQPVDEAADPGRAAAPVAPLQPGVAEARRAPRSRSALRSASGARRSR